MNDKIINLNLSVNDVNKILNALGDKPFVQVVDLISNIQKQSKPQLDELEETD